MVEDNGVALQLIVRLRHHVSAATTPLFRRAGPAGYHPEP